MKLALSLVLAAVVVTLLPELVVAVKRLLQRLKSLVKQFLQPSKIAKSQRAWPEVIDDLTAAVRSGIALEQALLEAFTRSPTELRKILQAAVDQLRTGSSLQQTLDHLLKLQLDAVGRRLIIALKIASSAGGKDVLTTLQLLAESVRRDLQLLDQLRAKQRSAITGAKVAVFAPWLVIAVTSIQPTVLTAYRSSTGILLLVAVALISVLAYLWMLQLARLKIGALQ
jgi:tight adherence protein B